jgi:hypothetical protein
LVGTAGEENEVVVAGRMALCLGEAMGEMEGESSVGLVLGEIRGDSALAIAAVEL